MHSNAPRILTSEIMQGTGEWVTGRRLADVTAIAKFTLYGMI